MVASFVVALVFTTIASILAVAGRMLQRTYLQVDSSSSAANAMARLQVDLREAKEVQILSTSRFRIFYPVMDGNGRYNRYHKNSTDYVEYTRATSSGTASSVGSFLWRKTNTTTGEAVATDIAAMTASSPTANSLAVELTVRKTSGDRVVTTNVTERVLYLRNN